MEFLASDKAQKIYAETNHEFPVKSGVAWSDRVKSWGSFTADELPLNTVAENRDMASKLVDKVAFNEGPAS